MAGSIDLAELDFENVGLWPMPVKIGASCLVLFLLVFCAYYFDTKKQNTVLETARNEERNLKTDFESKCYQASALEAYKNQLGQMEKTFGSMLRKLPNRTEIPGLLEDISKTGNTNGLIFTLFKPQPEVRLEFYAEVPIEIVVWGTYHRFAKFVSDIAALPRIVTLHDFKISLLKAKSDGKKNTSSTASKAENASEALSMSITAKTYRYSGDD